jgi:phosphoglycerate dehydrogenase-like enzyme
VSAPCVAVAEKSFRTWQTLFEQAALPVRYAIMRDPSAVDFEGRSVPLSELPAEVVWQSTECFYPPLSKGLMDFYAGSTTLLWVHSAGAGYDMPILQTPLKRGIRLTISHVNAIPIAEFLIRGVLEHFQRSDELREFHTAKIVPSREYREIHGTTWLIVGLGAIGAEVAKRVRAFGARVIGVRRNPTGAEPVDEMVKPDAIAAQLPRADVVVIAAPATKETANLVDAAFLSKMKSDAVLVNVARAKLVDEAALLAALDSGRPGFAVLDVHSIEERHLGSKEPVEINNPLWTHPKIALTPHAASGGAGRHVRSAQLFIDNLQRYLKGELLPDEVKAS